MDKDQVEFVVKSVIRTDGYLNYANTKSTILLTLSSATLATLAVNAGKLVPDKMNDISNILFISLISISFLLILVSMYFSIQSINPYLKASEIENTMSFVDITAYNKNAKEYSQKIASKTNEELCIELASLNFNLSNGLIGKYQKQKKSIKYFMASIISATFSIAMPNLIEALKINQHSQSLTVLLLLVVISLIGVICVMSLAIFMILALKWKNK
ncbi:hypothetical protein MXT04_25085 [Escherichia coli]|jgi:hypothetical protein|uniref:hypothetical protein n=1 Tax=Enterobacteriaceae TaxID=543 RepID=UPI001C297930|nr:MULTISPECIES: hypothetical protein [Enterobacteriaceae]HBG9400707.1 hypothetical protein [Citrobacter freundii]HBR2545096.1 hypothetical protein [Klebsiella pneumoniae]MDT9430005.1 hypothetical protein [Escherichia coli]MDT9471816.1 hypothetical protein [Escherichia coli]MEB7617356.1 hypothetical protein [Klebsiella michiganensis]